MSEQFYEKIDQWVSDVLQSKKNIATEIELREQSKVALNLFIQADVDHSETLSFNELKALCDMAGLPMEDDEEEALIKMDKDDSGALDIEEWVTWWLVRISMLPNPIKQQEAIARNTFNKFDADGSGCLDASELGSLTSALGADFKADELVEALAEIDSDESGVIEISEFVAWWTNRAAANRNNTSLISLKMRKLALKAAQVFSTDIFVACWNGDIELVKAFLVGEPRLALAADSSEHGEGWTALHYACYQGHALIVETLLEGRAEVNRTNDPGFSALFYAAQRGHIDICSMLLEKGADPSITGVYQPQAPLGSDGPPPVGAPEPEALQPSEIFMCPVEHVIDYPALKPLFKTSSKCAAPQPPHYDKISATLSLSTGLLALEVQQPQKAISHLPVKHWDVQLRMDMQMDPDLVAAEVYADLVASGLSIACVVSAVHPKQSQTYSVPLDKAWVKKLHFLCALHKLKRLQLLEASVAGLREIFVESCAIYGTIDPLYRTALNIVDFLYLLIKKCPDRKNTKDLRHSLRAALEQVNINNSNNANPPVEAGKTARKKGAESKEQDAAAGRAVDLKDPVALVHAAIAELLSRKAAAQAQLALQQQQLAQQEQLQRAEEEEVKGREGGDGAAPSATASKGKKPSATPSAAPAADAVIAESKAAAQAEPESTGPRWALSDGPEARTGFPTAFMTLTAVNSWGAGAASSTVSVNIQFGGKSSRNNTARP